MTGAKTRWRVSLPTWTDNSREVTFVSLIVEDKHESKSLCCEITNYHEDARGIQFYGTIYIACDIKDMNTVHSFEGWRHETGVAASVEDAIKSVNEWVSINWPIQM
jgi:hypothetical protein